MKVKLSRLAVLVLSVYLIFGFLYFFFSDPILFDLVADPEKLSKYQHYKGFLFIVVTAVLLFYFINREVQQKNTLIDILNESNKLYNLIAGNIPDIDVYLFDKEMRYLYAGGTEMLKYGIKGEELINKFPEETNTDKETLRFLKEHYSKILNGEIIKTEYTFQRNHYEFRGAPVRDDNNKVIAGLWVSINITEKKKLLENLNKKANEFESLNEEYQKINIELKQINTKLAKSEERYRSFISQVNEGVYRMELREPMDINMPVEEQIKHLYEFSYMAECNEVQYHMYGFAKESQIIGKTLKELHGGDSIPENLSVVRKFIQSGYRVLQEETKEPDMDGNVRYYMNNTIGIIEDGYLIRYWGTQTDITENKRYQEELEIALKRAEENDQLKNAFLNNLSHEIRTPMNSIIGFSSLLAERDLAAEKRNKFVKVIQANGNQLLRIIDDILDIAKIETNQVKIYPEKFALNKVLDTVKSMMENSIMSSGRNIGVEIIKDFPDGKDMIETDKTRLIQILMNLTSNAIRFTEEGTIKAGYTEEHGFLKFFVADTGIGIPSDKQKIIFDRFRQAEDDTAQWFGGNGLGLSISKGLVNLMGGKIWLASSPGEGTTFYFTLPLKDTKHHEIISKPAPESKAYQGKTILIAEDIEGSFELLKEYLKDTGIHSLWAENGMEAVKKVRLEKKIDLILMDIRMPVMNGYEAAKIIKEMHPEIPIIAQTAYAHTGDREKCQQAGCEDYLTKPVNRNSLMKLLDKYLME